MQIIGPLELLFVATVNVLQTRPPQKGTEEEQVMGLILTDPTVWTREAWGTFTAVPVIPIDTSSTVVAAGQKGILVYTVRYTQVCFKTQTDVYLHFFDIRPLQARNFLTNTI